MVRAGEWPAGCFVIDDPSPIPRHEELSKCEHALCNLMPLEPYSGCLVEWYEELYNDRGNP